MNTAPDTTIKMSRRSTPHVSSAWGSLRSSALPAVSAALDTLAANRAFLGTIQREQAESLLYALRLVSDADGHANIQTPALLLLSRWARQVATSQVPQAAGGQLSREDQQLADDALHAAMLVLNNGGSAPKARAACILCLGSLAEGQCAPLVMCAFE